MTHVYHRWLFDEAGEDGDLHCRHCDAVIAVADGEPITVEDDTVVAVTCPDCGAVESVTTKEGTQP